MRFSINLAAAVLFACAHASAADAQADAGLPIHAASAAAPLPASLMPDEDDHADEAVGRISARRLLVSTGVGALAGAGAGLLVGSMTTDGCQRGEEWCILSWEEEVAIHGVAGAMVGAGIGAVYGLVSGSRRASTEPTPVTIAPTTNGGLTVGLTLRH